MKIQEANDEPNDHKQDIQIDLALNLAEAVIKTVGPGFHPRFDASEYIYVGGDESKPPAPTFFEDNAERVNDIIQFCYEVLGSHEMDEHCLEVHRELFPEFHKTEHKNSPRNN